ncbi:MAG TPA: fibronectin type III domain-containing protein, partial [Ferruginibacter sp.]|nr:fibronectin type III domain-containing protein [Ferruginibacter sp.]
KGFYSQAQYPVQVTPQLIAPYTVFLSEYYNGTNPKIIVTLINRDLQRPTVQVRLRMRIKGSQVVLTSKDNVYYPPITLDAGIPLRLSLGDLAPYFNPANLNLQGITLSQYMQQGRLPEDGYEFCFEAVEVNTGLVVSERGCAYAMISLADPPLLNLPFKDTVVEYSEPTNINFTWTPRFVRNDIEYNFQLIELLDINISPENAFRTAQQPLYTTTTTSTNLLYGPAQPLLIPGKRYVWRVQAKNIDQLNGQSIFKNFGFSEVYWFTYMGPCQAPQNVLANVDNSGTVQLNWQVPARTVGYRIEYKNNDQPLSPWKVVSTTQNSYTITDAARGSAYSYKVGNKCSSTGTFIYSELGQFVVPVIVNTNAATGNVSWVYKRTEEDPDPSGDPLVSRVQINDEESVNPIDHTAGSSLYGMAGAIVKFYCTIPVTGNKLVGEGIADANGNYNIPLNTYYTQQNWPAYVEITHNSGLFNSRKRTVQFIKTPEGYKIGKDTLTIQSFQLKPSVFLTNYVDGDSVSVDVLIKKALFLDNKFIENAGLGDINNTVIYNNDTYVVLTRLYDGKAFKKLMYNRSASQFYVIRVNYQNKPSVFYPLNAVMATSDENGQKPVKLIKKRFKYSLKTTIEGVITYRNNPRRDVGISFIIKKEDILDDLPNNHADQFIYTTVTDASGRYSYNALPSIKPGTVINLSITDYSLRPAPFKTVAVYRDSNLIKKDVDLINSVYTAVGQLVDQDNYPVANGLVWSMGGGETTRTTDKGYYMLKVYNPGDLQFAVDGYDAVLQPCTINYAADMHPGDMPVSAQEWKSKVEATDLFKIKRNDFPNREVTADILGIGTGSLINRYTSYFGQEEILKNVIDLGNTRMQVKKGHLLLIIFYKGQKI